MALPTLKDGTAKTLTLNLPDLDEWRLNDMELFEPGGFTVKGFKAFMQAYSNWSPAEAGALTVKEMKDVIPQIASRLETGAVPNESGAGS